MRTLAAVAALVAATATPALGQSRPDFSGSWVASTKAPTDVPAEPSPIFGARLWLQHAGDRLTVVRPTRDAAFAATYPMDGSEVRTRIPGGVCRADSYSIETVAWDGPAIAFTLVGSVPPGAATSSRLNIKRLLRLESPDVLVVEATLRDSGQGETRRVATIYKRSPDPVPATEPPAAAPVQSATLAQVAWISGAWIGSSGTSTVEERWTPATGGSMVATARTLRGTAMTSFEFLCIVERNGGLVYTAMPNARTPATNFVLTAVTPDSATFENPKHDFPKLIRYTRRPDGSLETTDSGDANQKPETIVLKRE